MDTRQTAPNHQNRLRLPRMLNQYPEPFVCLELNQQIAKRIWRESRWTSRSNQTNLERIELPLNVIRQKTTRQSHSWSKARATSTHRRSYIRRNLSPTYNALLPAPRPAPPPPPFLLPGGAAARRGTRRRAKAPAMAQPFPLGRAPAKRGIGRIG